MDITEYLVTHGYGTVVWTTIVFFLLFFILAKFAWKPILLAVNSREAQIEQALSAAKLAQEEVRKIKASNEHLLKEARLERDEMIKNAQQAAEQMIAAAKAKAHEEAASLIQEAKKKISLETQAAVADLRQIVANVSLQIAEQILVEHLSADSEQQKLVRKNIENLHFN